MSSIKDLKIKGVRRERRKRASRRRIFGSADKPRLTVFRSLSNIYCQLIDDYRGVTLAQASTQAKDFGVKGGNCAAAQAVGKAIAEKAKSLGIERVQFDRNGYKYHGRVKALADAAREAGLKL